MSRKNKNRVRVPLPPGVTKREAKQKLRELQRDGVTTVNGPPTLLDAAENVRIDHDVQVVTEFAPPADPKTVLS
jgi:hypothetical protein